MSSIAARRPAAPVAPPLPVGATATMTIGGTCLPHQMNQAKFAAVEGARARYCCPPPPASSSATATMVAS